MYLFVAAKADLHKTHFIHLLTNFADENYLHFSKIFLRIFFVD